MQYDNGRARHDAGRGLMISSPSLMPDHVRRRSPRLHALGNPRMPKGERSGHGGLDLLTKTTKTGHSNARTARSGLYRPALSKCVLLDKPFQSLRGRTPEQEKRIRGQPRAISPTHILENKTVYTTGAQFLTLSQGRHISFSGARFCRANRQMCICLSLQVAKPSSAHLLLS